MPGGLAALDIGFPRFTGQETTEQKLTAIMNYLYMLLETLRYTLSNLDTSNWNKPALDEFVEMIRAGLVVADVVISNTVITQNLYAEFGDVAELTCDRLLTANKVSRYKNGDTADINYVWIQDQSIRLMTGTVVMEDETPQTVQHRDRNGELLYWKDAEMQSMSTAVTALPVTVYAYTELCKASLSFDLVDDMYVPRFVLGVGTGEGDNDRLIITKPMDKAVIGYRDDAGNPITLEIAKGGTIRATGNTGAGFSVRNVAVGDTAPENPQLNDLWIDTNA